ncbi:MAG: general secretion pathway protein GspK [Gammaproteobacteria bacterium]|nr:general secretion pathway protein GspK [Gammaproteobacteria bacterium]
MLIGFLALISQNAHNNAGMAMAISANHADDLAVQSAMALIKKGLIDWNRLGNEQDIDVARKAILSLPEWPQGVDFNVTPNSSKINLTKLTEAEMRRILEHRARVRTKDVDELIQAWADWRDADDNQMPQGAERNYYERLGQYNMPSNKAFQVPAELLFVRGYREAFSGVDVNAVFTVYGSHKGVDFNTASRETLLLLPGMTEEAVDRILVAREKLDLSNRTELALVLDAATLLEVQTWIADDKQANIYSIAVFPESPVSPEYAYVEIVEFDTFWISLKTLSVNPMARYGATGR